MPVSICSRVSSPLSKKTSIRASSVSATASIMACRAAAACSATSAGTSPSVGLPLSSAAQVKARILMRSTTPLNDCSEPIGTWIGTAERENRSWICSTVLSNEDRSRSRRLTTNITAAPFSSAYFQVFSDWTCTPATAWTHSRAPSQTRIAARASAMKFA